MKITQQKITDLANQYKQRLAKKVAERVDEMSNDDKSHTLIYRVLGVSDKEGNLIDIYQNKGRFLYKYAGAFLEEATIICFQHKFPNPTKIKVANTQGNKPKQFEIDCLVDNVAYEIKWRDATTDGDHITKEHSRVKSIQEAGYKPVRLMFFKPNRAAAQRIQSTLKTLYHGVNGEYYAGDEAWEHLKNVTGIDLFEILQNIANEKSTD